MRHRVRPAEVKARLHKLGAEYDALKAAGWTYRTIASEYRVTAAAVWKVHHRWMAGQYNPEKQTQKEMRMK